MDLLMAVLSLALLLLGFVVGMFAGFSVAERTTRNVGAVLLLNLQAMLIGLLGDDDNVIANPTQSDADNMKDTIASVAELLRVQGDAIDDEAR